MAMILNRKNRIARAAVPALLALLFSGSAAAVAASALGFAIPPAALYLSAAVAVALCTLGTLSTGGAVAASLAFVAAAAVYAASNAAGLRALQPLFASWLGQAADAGQVALGGRALLTCGAFTLGALFFALLDRREFVGMAIIVELAALVCGHAMSETASLGAAIPGITAAACAFALTGGVQREPSALRVLVPATLAVCVALALSPAGRVTWPPLEHAAERVRSAFEQYFRFTQERIAFSINEEGYDHAGEVGDSVVAMLGGPAHPRTDPVMSVDTDVDVLLRGSIRTAYTGWSWVDAEPKNRYLYYDLTHRSVRDRVFTPASGLREALPAVDVSVEMLGEGTSTLFVPGLLERFSMDLSTAVYYNTEGEVFLSRPVQAGDRYSLRALLPVQDDALRRAVIRAESADDARYAEILSTHTRLPEGIEEGVYRLTMQAVSGADNAWDRAMAIQRYLQQNMRYTLEPDYPPRGRDFASHFLLDTRRGYCSYYATAMAVMGRIAGLPTRYVEGYLARPGRLMLTGEDAHAWAEVYFRGVGWTPFDATGGATAASGGAPGEDGAGDGAEDEPRGGEYTEPEAAPTPAPGDEPTPPPEDESAPDPEPDDGEEPEPAPDETDPDGDDSELPDGAGGRRGGGLWWILALLLIALIALAARWVRGRLRASDPVRLCAEVKSQRRAALVAYRANLTLLAHMGQAPAGGESPDAFAARVAEQLDVPDFAAFARAVSAASYGRTALKREDVDAGLRAYGRFQEIMNFRERLRFALTRVFHGLGDFDSIP